LCFEIRTLEIKKDTECVKAEKSTLKFDFKMTLWNGSMIEVFHEKEKADIAHRHDRPPKNHCSLPWLVNLMARNNEITTNQDNPSLCQSATIFFGLCQFPVSIA
jgi:hypothetical protein